MGGVGGGRLLCVHSQEAESWMRVLNWLFPFFIGGSFHEMASFTFKVDFLSQLNLSGNALIGKCKGMFPW